MHNIRKWLAIPGYILTAIIIIFLLLPPALGFLAEKKCQRIVKIINTSTPLEIKILKYQRGWFKSEAQTEISLDKLNLPQPELYRFIINPEIIHGPLFIDWQKFYLVQALINADISLNPTQSQWLSLEANTPNKIANIRLRFKPNGSAKFVLQGQPLTYQNGEHSLIWKGMHIDATLSPGYTALDSSLNCTELEITFPDYNFRLGGINSASHSQLTPQGIWLGERELHINSLSINHNNNRTFGCDELHIYNQITTNTNHGLDCTLLTNLNKLDINGAFYNHGILELKITNMQPTFLTQLYGRPFTSSMFFSLNSNMFNMLLALASDGGAIHLKQLDVDTPWGKLLAMVKVNFASQTYNPGLLAILSNIAVDANVQAERSLWLHLFEKFYQNINTKPTDNPQQQATNLFATWEQSGKILPSEDGNLLYLNLRYQDKELTVNDKQLSIITKK